MELDEKVIQDALSRLLKRHNVEPHGYWASVRVFPHATGRSARYAVVIAYRPAKAALCEVLNFLSGGHEDEEDSKAGTWVLTEPQARLLCEIGIRTLGDLLYTDKTNSFVSESDWAALVHLVAAGDLHALHGLYDRAHRIVFTLGARITCSRETAEDVTLDVFEDVRQRASRYDADKGSVLGWIVNQARRQAIERLRLDHGMEAPRQPIDPAVSWPIGMLRPSTLLQERLARRIAAETGGDLVMPPPQRWVEPKWSDAAPGISYKLLASDTERDRVSMLVRLTPGVDYPPHTHASVEELHLLHGELRINGRKLYPGDYNRAEPGTADERVWSESGCTCVLITSARDLIN